MDQKVIPTKFFTYSKQDYIKVFTVPAGIKEIKYNAFAYSLLKKKN